MFTDFSPSTSKCYIKCKKKAARDQRFYPQKNRNPKNLKKQETYPNPKTQKMVYPIRATTKTSNTRWIV